MLHDVDIWMAPGLRGAISWAPTPPSIGHLIATVVWVRAVLIPEGGGHKSQTEEKIISPEHKGGWDRGRDMECGLSPKGLKGTKKKRGGGRFIRSLRKGNDKILSRSEER